MSSDYPKSFLLNFLLSDYLIPNCSTMERAVGLFIAQQLHSKHHGAATFVPVLFADNTRC